jgi:glycosyltransferase involved in cell wall biosynthesis
MPESDRGAVVDVGVPTFGSPRYLRETLESVLAQTFSAWRLTVSDNGGGNAREVVAPFLDDPRISYRRNAVVFPGDRGAAAGNWSGLVQDAAAPYVALLHDDDWWGPAFLERRVTFLEKHPECGLVFGPHVDVTSDGDELRRAPVSLDEGVHESEPFVRRFVRDERVHPSPPSVLVRREAYEVVGPRFEHDFVLFDSEMWLRLAVRFPVGYVAAHDSFYRVHGHSLSARSNWGESWLRYQEHVERLLDRDIPAAAFTQAERKARRSSALLSSTLDAVAHGRRRAALRLLVDAVRTDLRALVDPRVPLALVVLPFGGVGVRALQRIRAGAARRGIRVPFARPH